MAKVELLQIGDRVKVGGGTYRVTNVLSKFALAVPETGRQQAIKIDPVTSETVRLIEHAPLSTSQAETLAKPPRSSKRVSKKQLKAQKKRRGRAKVGKIVAVSSDDCVKVRYESPFVLWPMIRK